MRPVDEVVDEITAALPPNKRVQPNTRFARGG